MVAAIFAPEPAPTEPTPRVTLTVDGVTLTEPFDISWREVGSAAGSGAFSLLRDDPQVAVCTTGAMVVVNVDGTARFAWRIGDVDDTDADPGEEASEIVTFAGEGTAKDLDRLIVYPAKGVYVVSSPPAPPEFDGLRIVTKPTSPDRPFGWMEPGYDDSTWSGAVEVLTPAGPFRPEGFPDPDARWIWHEAPTSGEHPVGAGCLFRDTFTPVSDLVFAVKIFFAARDQVQCYVDDVLVAATDPGTDTDVGTHAREAVVEINGDLPHTISFRVDHPLEGMAGLVYTVVEQNTANVLTRSSDATLCLDAADEPGMTPGEIVNAVVDEAQARDATLVPDLATSFTATHDSGSTPWPAIAGDFAVRVGDSGGSLLEQLSEGWVEWAMEIGQDDYVGQLLAMWVAEGVDLPGGGTAPGRGTASGVTFAEGTNCTSIRHRTTDEIKNWALIAFGDGYLDGGLDTSVTAHGRREAFLSLGNVRSGVSAIRTAYNTLDPISSPAVSIVIEIEPDDVDEEPYTGVGIGDTVTAPDRAGTPTSYRVVSIAGVVDEDGRIGWTIELATARELYQQRQDRWLRRTAHGTLDGRSRSATPSSPHILSAGKVNVVKLTFSSGGSGEVLAGDIGTNEPIREPLLLFRSEVHANVAGITGATTFDTTVDASLVSEPVTAAVSQAEGVNDWSDMVLVDHTNVVNVEATAAGGHVGVTVTVLGVAA